jgi:hypothetical protein
MYFLNQKYDLPHNPNIPYSPTHTSPQITIFSSSTLLFNLLLVQINGVLSPSKDLTSTFSYSTLNLTFLAGIASMVMFLSFGVNTTLTEALSTDQTKGYTLFTPDHNALAGETNILAELANNSTALLALLENHIRSTPPFFFFPSH